MTTTQPWREALGLLLAVLLSGCGESLRPRGAEGVIRIELTSAPFGNDSVARADIFVVRVEGMQRDIDSVEAARAADAGANVNPETGFVTLATPNLAYNLLDLERGTTVELTTTELLLGTHLGFRVILNPEQSSITLEDGTVLRGNTSPGIQWPDPARVGVKLALDRPVFVDPVGTTTLLLDFNLRRMFVPQGASVSQDGFRFAAVVRGAVRDSTGSIEGMVRRDSVTGAVVADATIEVLRANTSINDTDPGNILRSGKTSASGAFEIRFLPPGTYAVRAVPPVSLPVYGPAMIQVVTVAPAARSDGNSLVLPRN